jgi:hypothetical protein
MEKIKWEIKIPILVENLQVCIAEMFALPQSN